VTFECFISNEGNFNHLKHTGSVENFLSFINMCHFMIQFVIVIRYVNVQGGGGGVRKIFFQKCVAFHDSFCNCKKRCNRSGGGGFQTRLFRTVI